MAFPVTSRTTGTLITSSIWNSDLKDNLNTLYTGGCAITSQAAGDFVYAGSSTQLARLAAVSGKLPKYSGGAWSMVNPTAGVHELPVMAAAMHPHASLPCGWHERITLTHGSYMALPFSGSTGQWAAFTVPFPKAWNEGTISFAPIWLNTAGGSGTVDFVIYGHSMSDGDAMSWSAASGARSSDTALAANTLARGPASSAFTPANTPATGDLSSFLITRDTGTDTFVGTAYLVGLVWYLTTDADTDD